MGNGFRFRVCSLWFVVRCLIDEAVYGLQFSVRCLINEAVLWFFTTVNSKPQTVNCLSASCHCCCHFEHTNIRQTLHNHKQPNPYLCPVKLVSILLASYILVLSCLPCSDSRECNIDSPTTIARASGNHQDHQHEDEACSMFCNCACCGQVFVQHFQPMLIELSDTPHARKELFAYHNDRLPADFYGNIWQPPKLS